MAPSPLRVGLRADEVEPWQRFPYLLRGYRAGGTVRSCMMSAFARHNETLNVWTMVLSLLAGIVLCAWSLATAVATVPGGIASWADVTPYAALLLGQALHTPASVCYHLCMPMSRPIRDRLRRADLTMAMMLNACATWAFWYFTWGWRAAAASTVAVTAIAGAELATRARDGRPDSRARIVTLIGLSAFGYYVPIAYNGIRCMASGAFAELPSMAATLVVACHGAAAACYVCHWPQRHAPGAFDLGVHSHVLVHVLLFACYNAGYPYVLHLHRTCTPPSKPGCTWPLGA